MNKSDTLDPKLNKMIVESIHNDVMEAMAAKGKIVYENQGVTHCAPSEARCFLRSAGDGNAGSEVSAE